jgi:hypothetical protein
MLKASGSAAPVRNSRQGSGPPDLQTQFESLLDQVWRSEAEWRLYDRIDAFCASQPDHCGVVTTAAGERTRWSRS